MTTLIKNAQVWQAGQLQTTDILIAEGRIKAIGHQLHEQFGPADHVICADQHFVSPGFVDVHVHLRDPAKRRRKRLRPER